MIILTHDHLDHTDEKTLCRFLTEDSNVLVLASKNAWNHVRTFFGGKIRDKVKMYANGWFSGSKTAENFAAKAKDAVKLGVKALKWDPFEMSHMTISKEDMIKAIDIVGAGTVINLEFAKAAHEAGAKFLVSPGTKAMTESNDYDAIEENARNHIERIEKYKAK